MNDFERKLSAQPLRGAPADLRSAVLGSAGKVVTPEVPAWREWLWPSPAAWLGLAAVWVALAVLAPLITPHEPRPTAQAPVLRLQRSIDEVLLTQR